MPLAWASTSRLARHYDSAKQSRFGRMTRARRLSTPRTFCLHPQLIIDSFLAAKDQRAKKLPQRLDSLCLRISGNLEDAAKDQHLRQNGHTKSRGQIFDHLLVELPSGLQDTAEYPESVGNTFCSPDVCFGARFAHFPAVFLTFVSQWIHLCSCNKRRRKTGQIRMPNGRDFPVLQYQSRLWLKSDRGLGAEVVALKGKAASGHLDPFNPKNTPSCWSLMCHDFC